MGFGRWGGVSDGVGVFGTVIGWLFDPAEQGVPHLKRGLSLSRRCWGISGCWWGSLSSAVLKVSLAQLSREFSANSRKSMESMDFPASTSTILARERIGPRNSQNYRGDIARSPTNTGLPSFPLPRVKISPSPFSPRRSSACRREQKQIFASPVGSAASAVTTDR